MDEQYTRRYPGPRWSLRFGSYAGIERVAVNDLQRLVQEYLPYVVETLPAASGLGRDEYIILVGTPESNPLLAELVARKQVALPEKAEGYTIALGPAPWEGKARALIVAGRDPKGVLNGVHAFGAQVLRVAAARDSDKDPGRIVDEMQDFSRTEAPAVEHRGIWTWGYVIYDYRRFFDHMARVRMNTLVVWNTHAPINMSDVIAYAHDRGIRVIPGFHWGWSTPNLKLSSAEHLASTKAHVLRTWEEGYAHLDLDGIYFQTATESDQRELDGRTTAAWACDWVNDIARALLEKAPKLQILFGLHASSIAQDYVHLAGLDPRVTIMWEDAGVTPYSYHPQLTFDAETTAYYGGIADFEKTLEYSKRLATFRPGTPFALVPKGWTALDWTGEFEEHAPFILGEHSRAFVRKRLDARQPMWDSVNSAWLQCYPSAARFYQELLKVNPAGMMAAGLVEDGLFEERVQPSVSLFAETLWNPNRPAEEILPAALSAHYLGSW